MKTILQFAVLLAFTGLSLSAGSGDSFQLDFSGSPKPVQVARLEPPSTGAVTAPLSPTAKSQPVPTDHKPGAAPVGVVSIPMKNGVPDETFVLPNGLTYKRSREVEKSLRNVFETMDARELVQRLNAVMDEMDKRVLQELARVSPEMLADAEKVLAFRKQQREASQAARGKK